MRVPSKQRTVDPIHINGFFSPTVQSFLALNVSVCFAFCGAILTYSSMIVPCSILHQSVPALHRHSLIAITGSFALVSNVCAALTEVVENMLWTYGLVLFWTAGVALGITLLMNYSVYRLRGCYRQILNSVARLKTVHEHRSESGPATTAAGHGNQSKPTPPDPPSSSHLDPAIHAVITHLERFNWFVFIFCLLVALANLYVGYTTVGQAQDEPDPEQFEAKRMVFPFLMLVGFAAMLVYTWRPAVPHAAPNTSDFSSNM